MYVVQEERVAFLRQQQDQYRACGERIEMHLKNVDNAIAVVKSALDSRVRPAVRCAPAGW
jgi:hypothetical protein